jgi:hypothetical protein
MGSNGTGIASLDAHDAGLDCARRRLYRRPGAYRASGRVP